MGWLQPVQGDGVMTTIDVYDEVLVIPFQHFVRPIIRLLQWSPRGIMANEDMCTCGKYWADVYGSLGWAGRRGL